MVSSSMIYCLPNLNLMVLKETLFSVNSYLLGRSQFVVCSDSGSELRHLPFGVPQGSVLGPTLFNIHINNVSKACHNSDVALFADNTEIHFSFKDVGEAEYIINEDLKSINQWFSNNGLICNTKKTMTMVIASHRAVKTARDHVYLTVIRF